MPVMSRIETSEIESRAKELGADLVAVIHPSPLEKESADLDEWLDRGYQANMRWMSARKEIRNDPEKLLPGCKSIIIICVNYFTPQRHLDIPRFPKISRYAWGRDYHKVLRNILKKLQNEIQSLTNNEDYQEDKFYIAVDSAPFRDKVWAQKAGLGWIGKHTNLISREFGSWFFIGALLTTLELSESDSVGHSVDHCGTCTKCIDACPTNAIIAPYQLDARACISYLTIEHDGVIPSALREKLDGWIFGCDICQDVCPWNRFEKPTSNPDFRPREGMLPPDITLLSRMTSEEYDELTTGTALRRAGKEKLRRNALSAMGLL